ncbi:GAF domain-containing protein [Nostoc sp. UCD121]|uniref:ATP-binding protein n=1 Tax=unclassified Nostoc TaxID=2593658 RepID=UPI00162A8C17|nr:MULTISPECIES: ATP-binding protein [unclassified Nostoc]MBC1222400.1 GAF domain-containing protein [Nostoc sp. UCD120]MBC1275198.1 GAF domain-containing protein [Nostoc sp. UCD121]MBC1294108.1 GAF domain-containing protein [Nostoc sp. UCD122]
MSPQSHSRILIKHFLAVFLPLSAFVGSVVGTIYYQQVQTEKIILKTNELDKVDLETKVISGDFHSVVSDLIVISKQNELQRILEGVDEEKQALSREFLSFSQYKKLYDQIRFLDQSGKEVVRVNFKQGEPEIVPEEKLQVQAKRYWFNDTLRLNQGEVFVSPLDLNIERGQVQQPLKPMIRFGIPVFDRRGQKRGIVVLNYFGAKLLDNFNQAFANVPSQGMLLNADGYWLKGAKSEDEWGFMFPERKNHTFGKTFPQAWQQISQKESGQFQTAEGMFTFTTVYPLLEGQKSSTGAGQAFAPSQNQIDTKSYYWKIVSWVSPEMLMAKSNRFLSQLLLLYAGLVGLIGIGSWLLAKASVNRQMAQLELKQSEAQLRKLVEREKILKTRLSSQIRNSLDLNTILSTVVVEVRELLQIDRCQFFWCHQEDESTSFELSQQAWASDLPEPLGCSPIQNVEALSEAILQGNLLCFDDIATDPWLDFKNRNLLVTLGFKSLLTVSVQTQSGRLGVIVCEHSRALRSWSDEEVELIRGVADQLAIAIDQAQLYNQSRAATAAATTQAEQLNQVLHNLKQTQAQLIQTEKMSSLGQLVAGVAHEINNPVNFIYGNLTHVNEYTLGLLELVELYQKSNATPTHEVQAYIEAIDLDFMAEDLPKILSSMKMGANRIREIVLSLRNFSRLDEADMKPVNIHEGIDSTLLILQNRLKQTSGNTGIEIVKEYGDIPLVDCYAGQLNQVFMNLISNAIDALDSYNSQRTLEDIEANPSQIVIRTQLRNPDRITIQIADNGAGITPAVKQRLFDPFFTTKPAGKGTGLGLAISAQIVAEKHNGAIWCISEPGRGAEFWVEIPISQSSTLATTSTATLSRI